MKIALTMFAAWALNPPTDPAIADPTKFLLMLRSTRASTLVLSTWWGMEGDTDRGVGEYRSIGMVEWVYNVWGIDGVMEWRQSG